MRDIVAGVLWSARRRRLIIARRPPGRWAAGLWEFPGGKVERGETLDQALARELREEIGIQVARARIIFVQENPYRPIRLHVYLCTRWHVLAGTSTSLRAQSRQISAPIRGRDHQPLRWIRIDQLARYAMPPPCRRLIRVVQQNLLWPILPTYTAPTASLPPTGVSSCA